MANTSHLLLTRIDHESKMLSVMRSLFEDSKLTDVILSCEGELIHAHKLILSSVSSYFQSIFQNPLICHQSNPVVIVKDMKLADLKAIIEFVYSGEVRIRGDQLESLVKSAETLDISGLSRIDPNPINHANHSPKENSVGGNVSSPGIGDDFSEISRDIEHQHHSASGLVAAKDHAGDDLVNDKSMTDKVSDAMQFKEKTSNNLKDRSDRRQLLERNIGNKPNGENSTPTKTTATPLAIQGRSITNTTKDDNSNCKDWSESPPRKLNRYNFRSTPKDATEQVDDTNDDTSDTDRDNVVNLRVRRSSVKETINVSKTPSSTPRKVKSIDGRFEPVETHLANISNKDTFKKPLDKPVVRKVTRNLYDMSSHESPSKDDHHQQQHHPNEKDSETMTSILKEIMYDSFGKSEKSKNKDVDLQSVCSYSTRSRGLKMLEKGFDKYSTPDTNNSSSRRNSTTTTPIKETRNSSSQKTAHEVSLLSSKTKGEKQLSTTAASTRTKTSQPVESNLVQVKVPSNRSPVKPRKIDTGRWLAKRAKVRAAALTTRQAVAKLRTGTPYNRLDLSRALDTRQKKIKNLVPNQRNKEGKKKENSSKKDETGRKDKFDPIGNIRKGSSLMVEPNSSPADESNQVSHQHRQPQQEHTNSVSNKLKTSDRPEAKTKRKTSDPASEEAPKTSDLSTRSLRPKKVKKSLASDSHQPIFTSSGDTIE